MKHIFFAVTMLLAITLFAFTNISKSKKYKNPDPELYWYSVTYDGSTPMIEYQVPVGPLTKAQMPGCIGSGRLCRSGFVEPLEFNYNNDPIITDVEGYDHFEHDPPPAP